MSTPEYQLTDAERNLAQQAANAVMAAKLQVYAANVALEDAKSKVSEAIRQVETAETRFAATVSFLAQSHGIDRWRIAPDFSRIETMEAQ